MKWFLLILLLINVTNINSGRIKNHFIFDPVQEPETNWNFTGCQVPYFMIVLIPGINTIYKFIKPFLDNEMSIFEEYGAFNTLLINSCWSFFKACPY